LIRHTEKKDQGRLPFPASVTIMWAGHQGNSEEKLLEFSADKKDRGRSGFPQGEDGGEGEVRGGCGERLRKYSAFISKLTEKGKGQKLKRKESCCRKSQPKRTKSHFPTRLPTLIGGFNGKLTSWGDY